MTSAGAPERSGTTRGGGTLYRGDLGMWSWVAHRITGVLTFFFLFTHVLDTARGVPAGASRPTIGMPLLVFPSSTACVACSLRSNASVLT